jgi:GNAT superfamily N-acetyltransferase
MLAERGYRPVEFASVMYRPVQGGESIAPNGRIRIRPVGDGEHRLWAETTARGWGPELPELAGFLLDLGRINEHREGALSFLAELDGTPVGTAALCLSGGVALLAGACTVPEARRQGVQLALLDARLRHAAGQGCDLAMMCAQPGGASQRNAERHGFRIAYTRTKWQLVR